MKSKGPPNPMSREGEQSIAIGGAAIGNAFGIGSKVKNDHSIHISGDVYGQVGQTLTNCTNTIRQQAPGERRDRLEELQRQVAKLIESLPADKKEEAPKVVESFEMLVKQATSKKPDRKWYSLSAEGLLEAATWVEDFSGKIGGTIAHLGKLLWPDYLLPGS